MLGRFEEILQEVRTRRWLAGTVCAAIVTATFFGWSMLTRVGESYADYHAWSSHANRIEAAEGWQEDLIYARSQNGELRQRLDSLYLSVPSGDRMSAVLVVLQEAAVASGVDLAEVRPEKVQGEKPHSGRVRGAEARTRTTRKNPGREVGSLYTVMPVRLRVTGGFHGIGRFVSAVERARYLMKVDYLKIERRLEREMTQKGEPAKLEADIRLRLLAPSERPAL